MHNMSRTLASLLETQYFNDDIALTDLVKLFSLADHVVDFDIFFPFDKIEISIV